MMTLVVAAADSGHDWLGWSTLVAVAAQALLIAYAFVGDMRRRKKQSTLEAWSATMVGHQGARRSLALKFKREELTKDDIAFLQDRANHETREHLTDYLNAIERLAVGARMGIYDEDVIYRLGRKVITGGFDRYEPFIEVTREQRKNPRLYLDLEDLADRFSARYKRETSDVASRRVAGRLRRPG